MWQTAAVLAIAILSGLESRFEADSPQIQPETAPAHVSIVEGIAVVHADNEIVARAITAFENPATKTIGADWENPME